MGSDDDTLTDDRKRELVTGRALWLIGDNLQRCPGQRFLGHPKGKSGAICFGKMREVVRQEKQ